MSMNMKPPSHTYTKESYAKEGCASNVDVARMPSILEEIIALLNDRLHQLRHERTRVEGFVIRSFGAAPPSRATDKTEPVGHVATISLLLEEISAEIEALAEAHSQMERIG